LFPYKSEKGAEYALYLILRDFLDVLEDKNKMFLSLTDDFLLINIDTYKAYTGRSTMADRSFKSSRRLPAALFRKKDGKTSEILKRGRADVPALRRCGV
jgi:hypothetical protein